MFFQQPEIFHEDVLKNPKALATILEEKSYHL